MANFFKNPLVLSETVVGSIVDTRALVLYEQPKDYDANTNELYEKDENGNTKLDEAGKPIVSNLMQLVDKRQLVELFTGIGIPFLSDINGFNMYGISYVDADVDIDSDLCDHPTEKGSIITDNAIINPIAMKVRVSMPTGLYTRIYTQMVKYYQQKQYILVQTKFAMYRNMVIQAMPYKLENSTIDRPIVELSLRQVMEVLPQYIASSGITNAKESEDNNTTDRGRLTSKVVSEIY